MSDHLSRPCTAFVGHRWLRSGPVAEVALAVKSVAEGGGTETILVFDDATGRVVDLDLRGSDADVVARLSRQPWADGGRGRSERDHTAASVAAEPAGPRGPGRPRLGVVGREVTLLPRHWEWLAAQPSGASAALRRLVDEARRTHAPAQRRRAAQEAAYRFMLALAGDRPGFEEATRALFADDRSRLEERIAGWPQDVRRYVVRLAFPQRERPAPNEPDPQEATPKRTTLQGTSNNGQETP
jgi:hypothetical protein